eukprot:TRINITY_DN2487_c0_g1_i1.p1 TRINITY_DN2487_c0_g1~~TRINITY_DN2487_c0_g1_i1.p1  ORF type:complete len:144 (-),score=32.06 TRINITY_DN2487_c0_g1_i1:45-476(-)
MKAYGFFLALLALAQLASAVTEEPEEVGLQCWDGVSTTQSYQYPPLAIVCPGATDVCRLMKSTEYDFWILSCTPEHVCKQDLEREQAANPAYVGVVCCTDDLCNSWPGQPEDFDDDDDDEIASGATLAGGVLALFISFFVSQY